MKIILATRNTEKVTQIRQIFEDLPVTIITPDEAGIEGQAEETGENPEDNALLKAMYAFHEQSKPRSWIMADDTGLFIKALNGEPGVMSRRWAGEKATTEEITNYTLERMKGVEDRWALFKSSVVLVSPDGRHCWFDGWVEGWLLDEAKVPAQPMMPYSPLFRPNGSKKVWAEMDTAEENAISHRGKAFRQARDFLERQLKIGKYA